MKTKKFFLMAAMLLTSVCTFAQSENNEPLKGDVNGDGKVDVADITAIVKIIMNDQSSFVRYFYLGTTQPTAENYKTLSGVVTSYSSIDDAIKSTVSVSTGETLYMMCPIEWMDGKNVEIVGVSENITNFQEPYDDTTIPGYAIYKTQVWNDASTMIFNKTYTLTVNQQTPQETFEVEWGYIHNDICYVLGTKKTTTVAGIYEITIPDSVGENGATFYFTTPYDKPITSVKQDTGLGQIPLHFLPGTAMGGTDPLRYIYQDLDGNSIPGTYTLIVS